MSAHGRRVGCNCKLKRDFSSNEKGHPRIHDDIFNMTVDEMKVYLDSRLPGFTKACDMAIEAGNSAVILNSIDVPMKDAVFLGIAVKYAQVIGVDLFSSNKKWRSPKGEPTPVRSGDFFPKTTFQHA